MKRNYQFILLISLGFWAIGATALLIIQLSIHPDNPNSQETTEGVSIFSGCSPDLELRPGPTWRNITVGESLFMDLEELYGVHFTRDRFSDEPFTNRFYVSLTTDAAYERGIAGYAEICTVGAQIAALELTVDADSELPASFLSAWVQQYGEPSLVTWGMSGNDWRWRTLVWPEAGIILNVDAGPTINDPTIGTVNSVTLAPFSNADDFLTEWPYSNLPDQPPTSDSSGDLEEQNPFDFESMLASQDSQE